MLSVKFYKRLFPLVLISFVIILSASCRKTKILTNGGEVAFSIDTLLFDTVFTAQGSATRSLKIYNKQKEDITVSSIRLKNGVNSAYRLNVNGISGTEIKDVDIAGNDSAWVFAAVTIDPTDENKPFVVDDNLIVTLNGKEFSIPVMAYGQNAYYIRDSTLQTQEWKTDKPYVIVNNALVDEGATLTIPAGCRVYVHQDSRLFVLGTLKITGTQSDSVVFQGDRLDPLVWIGEYADVPGQWGGLYFFDKSHDNEINYAVFKNGGAPTKLVINDTPQAVQGATIQLDPSVPSITVPKLKMTNSVIRSSLGYGIVAYNSSLYMENCKIVECGAENVCLFQGGRYDIFDCTIATYGGTYLNHSKNISLAVLNYLPTSETTYISNDLTATIKNCIVYGSLETETVFDKKDDNDANVVLSNCILKSKDPLPSFVQQTAIKLNEDPMFKDYSKNDHHLQAGSPAVGTGINAGTIPEDLDGVSRLNPTSMGCYEFKP
ncbi:right-handed parallel beta-helix repeat-containing protein [Taibaiella lutea]|uniref:Right-handed parallel beta-helix repeat-containing protein n=1 Tax=Taibaiella lutea TaxID=2608001 RepID=A0A5M6CI52_9BACT|nr:right-handed parallel beta-helix repeat-containing protein [Taibaiella lutea]KAA5534686.1 right-handed parallel beta-helix repeat-containing protein [Taibaiella lutea]